MADNTFAVSGHACCDLFPVTGQEIPSILGAISVYKPSFILPLPTTARSSGPTAVSILAGHGTPFICQMDRLDLLAALSQTRSRHELRPTEHIVQAVEMAATRGHPRGHRPGAPRVILGDEKLARKIGQPFMAALGDRDTLGHSETLGQNVRVERHTDFEPPAGVSRRLERLATRGLQ